jgi:hypothetical protein
VEAEVDCDLEDNMEVKQFEEASDDDLEVL